MATSDPIELATEIMVAFVANNAVPRADLPALFEGLHSALKRLADGREVAPAAIDPPAPAVSIRKSVTPDYLICLEDGKRFKSLRRHLATLGMTPEQYRAKWNLPSTYPMVAPNSTAQRSAFAKNIGFGLREKPIAAPSASAAAIEVVTDTIEVIAPEPGSVSHRDGCGEVGVTRIPAGDNWAHEIKFDGFRMHARIVSGAAALLTRNGLDWTSKYPDVAAAIGALNCRQAYVDGELCAVLPDGTTSFSGLQGHGDAPAALVYFAFDLLHLDGEDLARLPLLERKARLEALFADAPPVLRFSGHVIGNGARVAEEGAKLGVEGMVSKQIDKPYLPGNRGVWVKTKFLNRQEFVIVGWTDPEGSRSSLGSLLLGYYRDDGKLI